MPHGRGFDVLFILEWDRRVDTHEFLGRLWVNLVLIDGAFDCSEELPGHFDVRTDLAAGQFELFNVRHFGLARPNVKTEDIYEALRG